MLAANTNSIIGTQQDVMSRMKSVDSELAKHVVPSQMQPTFAGADKYYTDLYTDPSTIPVQEKVRYSKFLVGNEDLKVQIPLTDEDVAAAKEKAWVATLRDFDKWVITSLRESGLSAPEKREWIKKVYPELVERMVESVKLMEENKEKFDKIALTNPTSIDDLVFMYFFMKESKLSQSTSDFSDMLNGLYTRDAEIMEQKARIGFQRGIFNGRKVFLDLMHEWALDRTDGDNGSLDTRKFLRQPDSLQSGFYDAGLSQNMFGWPASNAPGSRNSKFPVPARAPGPQPPPQPQPAGGRGGAEPRRQPPPATTTQPTLPPPGLGRGTGSLFSPATPIQLNRK